jgi:hypothetical protein
MIQLGMLIARNNTESTARSMCGLDYHTDLFRTSVCSEPQMQRSTAPLPS